MNEPISSNPGTTGTPGMASTQSSDTAARVKETARETKETVKAKVSEVAGQARERGEAYLEEGKERAAGRIEGYGESLRETASRFERENDPNIAHYTSMMADKLESAASYIRERDFRDLRRDAEDLARRHPAVFFGGMFIAGLAAARFFKASYENQGPSTETSMYDTGYNTGAPVETATTGTYPTTPVGVD